MTSAYRGEATRWTGAVIAVTLLATFACTSHSAKNAEDETSATESNSAASAISVMCMGDRISNPPESFHYSYKYSDAADSIEQQADITPQSMDITAQDNSGTHSYRGTRSDDVSWNNAVLDLSSLRITGMSARLDSLNRTSSISRQGSESINGYQAIKYSIDTAGAHSSDQETFATLFGQGSFEKGTIWTSDDGCVVKLILDEGLRQTDGSVKKAHFEMARIRK